jgi:ubiquinone/menaquinone biosynthesis C-methylase UbiE
MIPCSEKKVQYLIPLPTRLVSFLKDKPAKNILEVGCGYGRACFLLRENCYDVTGVDIDRVQIKSAVKEAKSRGIDGELGFLINDARNLCFPDSSFDTATMLALLTLIPKSERPKILNEVWRVLKPFGYVFIEEFGRTWENPVYAKRYKDDVGATGEMGTIIVKDENGKILHFGHHFTREELYKLLRNFYTVSFEKDMLTSYCHRNWVKGYVILAQKRAN